MVSRSIKKLFFNWFCQHLPFLNIFFNSFCLYFLFSKYSHFLNIIFKRICPVEKCRVTPHCLYRDSLSLKRLCAAYLLLLQIYKEMFCKRNPLKPLNKILEKYQRKTLHGGCLTGFWIHWGSGYTTVLSMQRLIRVLNMFKYGWIIPWYAWLWYAEICLNSFCFTFTHCRLLYKKTTIDCFLEE